LKLQKDNVDVRDILPKQDRAEGGRLEATAIELDIAASTPQPQATATNSGTKPKRKWGDKKNNQYPDKACYVIIEVEPAGEIRQLKCLRGRFRNMIGP